MINNAKSMGISETADDMRKSVEKRIAALGKPLVRINIGISKKIQEQKVQKFRRKTKSHR
jgi:hypothetical protein